MRYDSFYFEYGSEDYRYTGKQEDTTGLYYYGARYYDPATGRFITRDTVFGELTDPQSQNRYVYCRNNPHKYIDPVGESPVLFGALVVYCLYKGGMQAMHYNVRNPTDLKGTVDHFFVGSSKTAIGISVGVITAIGSGNAYLGYSAGKVAEGVWESEMSTALHQLDSPGFSEEPEPYEWYDAAWDVGTGYVEYSIGNVLLGNANPMDPATIVIEEMVEWVDSGLDLLRPDTLDESSISSRFNSNNPDYVDPWRYGR